MEWRRTSQQTRRPRAGSFARFAYVMLQSTPHCRKTSASIIIRMQTEVFTQHLTELGSLDRCGCILKCFQVANAWPHAWCTHDWAGPSQFSIFLQSG